MERCAVPCKFLSYATSLILFIAVFTTSCQSVGPNCGNEKHVLKSKKQRNGVASCGNEKHLVKRHKKVKKSKTKGVLGKSRHKNQWNGTKN